MPTAIIRPTAHIDYSNTSYGIANMEYLYDNDTSTYAKSRKTINGIGVLINFDTSSIPEAVKNGGKIISISFCILNGYGANDELKIRAVYGATSTSDYTDCGDESVALPLKSSQSSLENKVALPKATEYWNQNINDFFNGGFQIRLSGANAEAEMQEAYAYVEYEMPRITVTTEASPAEGGIVTGGGVYESGSTFTLTATPNRGYAFSHWQIGETVVGAENPISGSLIVDATVTAVFIEKPSKVYCGTKKCSVYCGTKKVSVYCGTQKLV